MARRRGGSSPAQEDASGLPRPSGIPGLEREEGRQPNRERRAALVRATALVVVIALVVVFIFENLQTVAVHLWVTSRHIRLIWVIAGSLLMGGVVGYFGGRRAGKQAGRGSRRRRKDR